MPKLEDISVYFDLLPVLVILLFFRRIKIVPIWVIFLFCIYSFINNQVIIYRDDRALSISDNLQYFTLFEYLTFATVIYFLLRNKLAKLLLIGFSLGFVIFCIVKISAGKMKHFDSIQTSYESIIIISYCLFFLAEQIFNPQIEFIYNSYKFWLIVGMLIYLAGAFFVFAFATQLGEKEERDNFWKIMFVCNIIKNLLFSIAVWLSSKPIKENKKLAL